MGQSRKDKAVWGTEIWAYAAGGLGSKSTLSMVRMSSSGFAQNWSGFSPGTAKSSLSDGSGSCLEFGAPTERPKPILALAAAA